MAGTRQKLRLWLVLLMMCAVFFALGYGTRVLHERAGRYDFRPQLDTTTEVSGHHTEAAAQPIQPSSHGASMIPRGAILLQVARTAMRALRAESESYLNANG